MKHTPEKISDLLMNLLKIAMERKAKGFVVVKVYTIDGGITDVVYAEEFRVRK